MVLVEVNGVKSRFVCIASDIFRYPGLVLMIGTMIKLLPTVVLGGTELLMFGAVAVTGIRILSNIVFKTNRKWSL